jgi:putative cell wall-binding protein
MENQNALDALVPREVKGMIENYKKQMMEFISENLNKYENEATILTFLEELNLPYSLETVLSQNEISESLWKKISEVQQKGGSLFLTSNITNLEKKAEEIFKRIAEMQLILKNEEDEDTKYRNMYGERWKRAPSKNMNIQYYAVLHDYFSKI